MVVLVLLVLTAVLDGCSKSNFKVISHLNVRLTSLPYQANEVIVDITQLQVTYDSDTTWQNLATPRKAYNLLQFANNTDTLIASGPVPATSIIRQLKITFGNKSTINKAGKLAALHLIPGRESLILSVNKKMNRFTEVVTLQFDPAASVTYNGNGYPVYFPVITLK